MPVQHNTAPFLSPFRVQENLTAPGTTNPTVGVASQGYRTFAQGAVDAFGSATSYYAWYTMEDVNGNYEIGVGLYSSTASTLTRSPVYSSNAGALVNFSGSCVVYAIDAPQPLSCVLGDGAAGIRVISATTTPGRLVADGLGVFYAPFVQMGAWGSGASGELTGMLYARVSLPYSITYDPSYFDGNTNATANPPGAGSVAQGLLAQALGKYGFASYTSVVPVGVDYTTAHQYGAIARFSGSTVRGGVDTNTSGLSHAQSHDVVLSFSQTSGTSAVGTLVQPQITTASNTTSLRSLPIPINTAFVVAGEVIGVNGTDYASFRVFATFFCGATPSTLVMAASPAPVAAESATAGASAWTVQFALDTTNGVVNVTATSIAAHWVANLRVIEAGV